MTNRGILACGLLLGLQAAGVGRAADDQVAAATSAARETPAPSAANARAATGQAASPGNRTSGRIDLPDTVISGQQELPKVLYILPWRSLGPAPALDQTPLPGDSELFEPLDPDAHARVLEYRRLLAPPASTEAE